MKKLINGNKVLVISHEDDIDGLGGVILGYLAFKDVDYMLIHIKEQTEIVDFVKNSNYEKVFITDLGLDDKIHMCYNCLFRHKDTGEETKIYCVTNYYNLNDIPSQNGKLKCFNVKKELAKRDIPHCIHENCAKCHVACIDDFQEGKITKK